MKATSLGIILAVAAMPCVAPAGVVHHSQLTEGQTGVSLMSDGIAIDVTASPRAFRAKTVNGVTGVGIKYGVVDGEIDLCEMITFELDEPVYVTSLVLTHLFTDGQFGDHPAEVARVVTDAGTFSIEATQATSGTWTGAGALSNLSIATTSGAGQWMAYETLASPQGIFGAPVTSIALKSGNPGVWAACGDFSFVELGFRRVPAPGTISAFALAAGLAMRRRRSRA